MHFTISPTGLSPPTVGLPRPFGYHDLSILKVLQPRTSPVWALPTSLAATTGIDLSFFSSRYLDVSVPWVSLHTSMYSMHDVKGLLLRVFPFGYLRIIEYLLLPVAYRSLSRPSSPSSA